MNICWRATAIVDGYVNQVFRSTVDTEQRSGPGDYRINVQQSTGNIRWTLSRWPVTEVLAAQWAANIPPLSWTQIPPANVIVDNPVIGLYGSYVPGGSGGAGGQSIIISAGWGGWSWGRNGCRWSASYLNGWPHAGLTGSATAGQSTLTVDDVTGWAGATGMIYDGVTTETIQVASVTAATPLTLPNGGGTAPAGPGTLTLASPLLFNHTGGNPASVVVSAIPSDVLWATALAAASQALEAGITSVSIQNLPGSMTTGGHGVEDLKVNYELILEPYRRVI